MTIMMNKRTKLDWQIEKKKKKRENVTSFAAAVEAILTEVTRSFGLALRFCSSDRR